ncbi:MAG: hypothetical protein JW815_02100 [Candidatus Bathyarchaeota archaeon]|nr:hypothetical protein [Candidatus Bathyarchaeum sp.]
MIVLLFTVVFAAWVYVNWFNLSFFVGDLFFVHWVGLAATIFVAIMVPVYYVLKHKNPKKMKLLLRVHVFGNLLSFLLISVHFAQNTGRLSAFPSKLGDGLVLFLVMSIIVATGMLVRFGAKMKFVRYFKLVHSYAVVVFYFMMAFHVLQFLLII